VGDNYGLGYGLVQLKTWLAKVALVVEEPLEDGAQPATGPERNG